jgi:hypothetical protein
METENIPDILYKYRDWDDGYHRRLLVNNEVYFATPRQFNDPFDCAIPFRYDEKDLTEENIFKKALALGKKAYPHLDDTKLHELAYKSQQEKRVFDTHVLEKQDKERQEHFNQEFCVLSLTTKRENFLMWSHYSKSHSGFCVGFNSAKLYHQSRGQLGPVIYSVEFPKFGLFDHHMEHFIKYVYHKSTIWEYEQEYRLLKEKKYGQVVNVTNDTIEEIILGTKMKQENKNKILDIAAKKFPDARVFDSKPHKEKFEIAIERIR